MLNLKKSDRMPILIDFIRWIIIISVLVAPFVLLVIAIYASENLARPEEIVTEAIETQLELGYDSVNYLLDNYESMPKIERIRAYIKYKEISLRLIRAYQALDGALDAKSYHLLKTRIEAFLFLERYLVEIADQSK